MDISLEDRYAVLEERLRVAETAIYNCRAMLHYVRRLDQEVEEQAVSTALNQAPNKRRSGLFPGQYDNHIDEYEDLNPAEAGKSEQECVE